MKQIALSLAALFILACDLPRNLRTMDGPDSSVIGISVRTVTLKIVRSKAETVYFVKLDEKDENNLGSKIIPSNFSRGGYAYLVNAKPGRYAAVASFFTQTDNSYNTFYDAALIQGSMVEVGPKQIVYAGDLLIENRMKNLYENIEQNGDRSQLHYYNLLKSFMYGLNYCGSPIKIEKSREGEIEFLNKTKSYFKKSDWLPLIDSMIESSSK